MPTVQGAELRHDRELRWACLGEADEEHAAGNENVGAVKSDRPGFQSQLCHLVV